jgi:hypothetical protein
MRDNSVFVQVATIWDYPAGEVLGDRCADGGVKHDDRGKDAWNVAHFGLESNSIGGVAFVREGFQAVDLESELEVCE